MSTSKAIVNCENCTHCFRSKRSATGYSCEVWGHEGFACDTVLHGYCHKFNPLKELGSLDGIRMFKTRQQAADILNELHRIASLYGIATRADFMELMKVESKWIDRRHGWTNQMLTDGAKIVSTPFGYFIELPKSFKID